MGTDSKPSFLVVIGSSAGGIEALSILLAGLPTNFGAPIVVAQHLDPNRPSSLALVLERKTSLPVVLVETTTKLAPGTVYVVPSNRHAVIHDGTVSAEGDHTGRPRPSVDLLLSSAAEQYGDRLIALILTGAGADGASGALDVKRCGGTVIIQNPATARFPSMPLALPPTAVDHIADLPQLAGLLDNLVNGLEFPDEPKTTDGFSAILNQVSTRAGVDFSSYKQSTILRRIARRMVVTQKRTLEEYRAHIEAHREEADRLALAFLIKVTEFFRDDDAFEFLRDHVLPTLVERARARGRVLRIWSAGCATGEEPYSIAMLLADHLGDELPAWNVKIFATDLDEGSIAFARRGLYPEKVLGKVPQSFRQRFFEETDAGAQLTKQLRQLVIFGHQDISKGVPFPRIDLVVCRNLLIYFKPEMQQHVLELFAYSLSHAGGFLFLGKAETARPSNTSFELVDKRWKVYRCTKPALAVQTRRLVHALPTAFRDRQRRPSTEPEHQHEHIADGETNDLRRFNEMLLRVLPIGIAIVDRAYRVLTINHMARRLFGIRDLGQEQDFLHAVRGLPYGTVRDAIDLVFRDKGVVTLNDLELESSTGPTSRFLSLGVAYSQHDAQSREVAIITVTDATESVHARHQLEAVQGEQSRLVSELTSANQRFAEMNKELQDANEELQATNEEMSLAQEELQAANEELEATNEELQATNEELETNNEELQATNEELEATNEELSARTGELQDVARTLSAERVRLTQIIEGAPVYVLLLRGPTLLVEAANPKFSRLLGDREWMNRPIEDVLPANKLAPIIGEIRDAYWNRKRSESVPFTIDTSEGEAKLRLSVVPSLDPAGKPDGVVIFATDV